ncbi:Ribonuclease II/R domain-containing protein [Plasmodiophora brassicae]
METAGWKVAQTRIQHRRSRFGKVVRVVEERYLRLDIPCPFAVCEQCCEFRGPDFKLLDAADGTCLVPDADALIRQLDVIASPLMTQPVLLLQSVLEEVYSRSRSQYHRVLRDLRSAPIFMDMFHKVTSEGLSQAILWLSTHLPVVRFQLLTDAEPATPRKGFECGTVETLVNSSGIGRLADLLAVKEPVRSDVALGSVYPVHWEGKQLEDALRDGTAIRSSIRVWASGRAAACTIADGLECRIEGMENINRAIDGDQVAVHVANGQPPRVVAVLQRNWRPLAGSLLESDEEYDPNRTSVWFVPIANSIPRVKIHTHNVERLIGQRFVVRIDSWVETQRFPSGHVIQMLGPIGDQQVESSALLIEYGVRDEPFTDAVMECCPPNDWVVRDEDCAGRIDLRDTRVISIDPPGCTDIDDALHIRRLPGGLFEVGVHIADVSHFVKEGDAIDREAQARGTSVYLVDRRIDMIPPRLSTHICSLRDNVDRLAFSCFWIVDADANVRETRFAKTVIRSKGALAYADAQAHIDDVEAAKHDDDDGSESIGKDVRDLNRLALRLRTRRLEAGALTLASPEIRFRLDRALPGSDPKLCGSEATPLDIQAYQVKQANSLVEEFMLLANIAVAEQIVRCYPGRALLRRHPPPSESSLMRLVDAAKVCDQQLEVGSSKALADSLDRVAAARSDDPSFDNAMRIYATRCMNQAVYFCSGSVSPGHYLHYGLATPLYTHFTSPIRRYADLVVHRLLSASLSICDMPAMCKHKGALSAVTNSLNRLNRSAQLAGRASVELFTLIYFDGRQVDTNGIVMDVRVDGVTVFIKEFGIEGKIDLLRPWREARDDDVKVTDDVLAKDAGFLFDETAKSLSVPGRDRPFTMFSPARVRIEVEHRKHGRRNLVLSLLDEGALGAPASKRARIQ